MAQVKEVVIVDAVRSAVGRYNGVFKHKRPDDMIADVIKGLMERNPQVDPASIEEVVLGNANQAGEDNRNVARMASILAGLPEEVGGTTLNRLCGSGLDAVSYARRAIALDEGEVFIAGGVESMTRAPFVMAKPEKDFPRGNMEIYDTTIGWRFTNPKLHDMVGSHSMPETAQEVADRFKVSREAQDEFAYHSQMKTKEAMENGKFEDEIIPVETKINRKETTVIKEDEHPRPNTTLDKLSSLKPLFPNGSVTAGNASGVNDGASAVLLMSKEKAQELGLTPIAVIRSAASTGVEPQVMGLGPINASNKALKRAGIRTSDLGLVELNEAFASQSLVCIDELGLNPDIVNVNGGAIALGHALGSSGSRLLTTLVHEMKRREVQYGLATMCIGVGQGIAMVVERYES
ncbi:thiolase family protein [Alteribacillus iranensis]|uniref:acetyl-CoA C-acyltransferase n=1 Tax=Alteribacillus iranensis TaxID=930128 RepID=A0A1I2BRB3_9BACI|nr:acetyl-CoA C-acyltransferase [Alteribacillus iranensis]SFE57810.1 3-oxo-5,6-didehydrosuberyl-CoA/3-oxoadipyl-CoA thiolase [Alteribacillus iranensis]